MITKHPATYTKAFIPKFAELLYECRNVLDPCAGTGKIAMIKDYGYTGRVVCNEIEPEWVKDSIYKVDEWHIGDAADMNWAPDGSFEAICTSPTYGNRMADHFNAKDNSRRITYKHYLGRDLHNVNTGKMQWGNEYKSKHIAIYKECVRVLNFNGLFILNISDHIRNGEIIPVSDWHKVSLLNLGLTLIDGIQLKTPRMNFGANRQLRVQNEIIFVFKKERNERNTN
jgi:hypothetical protein